MYKIENILKPRNDKFIISLFSEEYCEQSLININMTTHLYFALLEKTQKIMFLRKINDDYKSSLA